MKQTNESGRSMVEMLGVLAIIGVLSVAGIAGYTTAMRSYRTNEIVNAVSMLHVMATAQNAGNGPNANVAYTAVGGSNPSGVSTLEYNANNKNITITFTDTNDCTMALSKLGDKASGTCPTLTVTLGENNPTNNYDCPESTQYCDDEEITVPAKCLFSLSFNFLEVLPTSLFLLTVLFSSKLILSSF